MPDPNHPGRPGAPAGPGLGDLADRCPGAEVVRFRDGDLLLREGDPGREVLIVTEGSLVVERGTPPTPLAQLHAEPGAPVVLGEMAYFGTEARSATVRSVGAGTALRLRPEHLDRALEAEPALALALCRQFTVRLREAIASLAELRTGLDLAPERRLLQDGEAACRAGEPAEHLFQLVLGRVRLEGPGGVRSAGPEDLPGGFLGLEPWLRGGNHAESAFAEGSAFLAAVGPGRREAFLRRHPALALAVLRMDRP